MKEQKDYLSYLKKKQRFHGLLHNQDYLSYLRDKQRFHWASKKNNDLFSRSKIDMGGKACSFYILASKGRQKITKIGISKDPNKRVRQHRSQTNIAFKIYKEAWFESEEHAKIIEQSVIKHLHRQGYKRSGKEFFYVKPEFIFDVFYEIFLRLKDRNQIF